MKIANIYINRFLHLFETMKISTSEPDIYLTFDDGPEGEITDIVLDLLNKYEAKATFFCIGEKAKKNSRQYERIIEEGHSIGNHTFSHINDFHTSSKEYIKNVELANDVFKTHLFRPPWGSLTLTTFLILIRKYKIVYWNSISGDTEMELFNLTDCFNKLVKRTKKGDIVLFHSCNLHANETKQILPLYLEWLYKNGYKCNKL